MILRIVLFFLAAPAIQAAINIPVVCPCTFVANRVVNGAVKVVKNIVSPDNSPPLPILKFGETYDAFIIRVWSQEKKESAEDYYVRIYQQYKDEEDEKYVERIDKIYELFPNLPCRHNTDYWQLSSRYYTLKYGKLESIIKVVKESNDQYFARILRREKNEDFATFIKRLDCIFKAYPKLDIWRRVKFDSDSRNWYFFRHDAYNCAIRPSENIRESVVIKYARRGCEKDDDVSYFKRICTRLQSESDEDYVERLTRIRSKFSDLPLWNSCEYIDLIKDYYRFLYVQKEKEPVNDYYKRLTTKSTTEDVQTYVKRMEILQRVFNNLPLWNNCDFLQFTAPFYNYIYAKRPQESDETYLKRITTRAPGESLDYYLNRVNVCRWVNRGADLFYNKYNWHFIKNYYLNFFKKGKQEVDIWLGHIFKRDFEESDAEYVKRCSLIVSAQDSLKKVDIPESCLKPVSDFYRLLYKRLPGEDKDTWLQRVTKRLPIETDVTYETRLKYLENIYTDCRSFVGGVLKKVFGFGKSINKEADKDIKEALSVKKPEISEEKGSKKQERTIEEEIEEVYGKKQGEDEIAWFNRLVTKSPGESPTQYAKTLTIVRKLFPSIPLWYDSKNFDLVKEYYSCLYNRLPNESDDAYFSRIVSKEAWETWEQTASRVALVRRLYPDLPLWTDEQYYDKYIKQIYEVEYKKKESESYDEYIQRVLSKDALVDTSDLLWAKRVHLIQLATASCPVWYDEKYYGFTKNFFESWYKKVDSEGCTSWLTKVLKPMTGESEENAIKRVRLIKETTGGCGCWTEFTFKKVASSKCLAEEYLNDIENSFFDSATTYERIYSSSKTKSKIEESSAEKSVEVVKKY